MRHFFVEPGAIRDHDIYIEGKDYNHIRNVLRMGVGDTLSVFSETGGKEYRCHIEAFEEDRIHLRLDFIKEADVELPVSVTLYQGLPKSDKMDFIVEKAVELGISKIVPVYCSRSIPKLDRKKSENRCARWNAKAEAAAKQSRRAIVPYVTELMTFEEAVADSALIDTRLIPYELSEDFSRTRELLRAIEPGSSVGIFIGPEGGFSEEEIALSMESGGHPITLGKRILRTETAALVVLSWLIYLFE